MSRTAPHKQFPPTIEKEELKFHPPRPREITNQLGHYGGLHAPYRTEDLITLEMQSVNAAVNLAKQVNIANETEHLVVRDILPDRDFMDGNGNTISGRGWRQPWSGWYESTETDVKMYQINRNVDYHNKCYVFWGLRYVSRGPGDPNGVTDAASLTWKDSVNTYDIWDTEGLDVHREMYAFKPILVKNYVEYSIYVRPKLESSGNFDNIQILGKVCEKAGDNLMGSPQKIVY